MGSMVERMFALLIVVIGFVTNLAIGEQTHFPNSDLYDVHPPFQYATKATIVNEIGLIGAAGVQSLKEGAFFVATTAQIGQCGAAAVFSEAVYLPAAGLVKVRVDMRMASFTSSLGLQVGGATVQAVPLINGQTLEPVFLNSNPSESALRSALTVFLTGVGLGPATSLNNLMEAVKLVDAAYDTYQVIDAIKQIDRAWGFKHRVVYFTFQAPRAGWYRVGIGIEATTFAAGTCISTAIAVGFVDKILINY